MIPWGDRCISRLSKVKLLERKGGRRHNISANLQSYLDVVSTFVASNVITYAFTSMARFQPMFYCFVSAGKKVVLRRPSDRLHPLMPMSSEQFRSWLRNPRK